MIIFIVFNLQIGDVKSGTQSVRRRSSGRMRKVQALDTEWSDERIPSSMTKRTWAIVPA